MAATPTYKTAISNNQSPGQTVTTGSFTPTANTILVAIARVIADSHTTTPSWSMSGGSLTWTKEAESAEVGDNNYKGTAVVFSAVVGGSPSSMTVQADPYSGTDEGYIRMVIYEVAGGNSSNVLDQVVFNEASGAGPLALTLPQAPAVGAGHIWTWWGDTNSGDTATWDVGPANLVSRWDNSNGPMPVESFSNNPGESFTSRSHGYSASNEYNIFGCALILSDAAISTTYGTVISDLSPEHHWPMDTTADDIGTATMTNVGGVFTGTAIARDVANSWVSNGVGDRMTIPTTTNINNSAMARHVIAGWFRATAINQPFTRIYGEGDAEPTFQFMFGFGNTVTFECYANTGSVAVQVYSDRPLIAGRVYHLTGVFEGNAYDNRVKFFLDGVEQLVAEPTDRRPDTTTLATRTVQGVFSDPTGTVGLNGTTLTTVGVVNGEYNHWVSWGDSANAELSDAEIRVQLFEAGALAGETISSGTEVAMQSALDTAVANSSLGDEPLNIEVEAVTGGGDFTLDLDDVIFDDKASIHVRYNGTADTLTIRNTGTSNASIGSAPFGGTIVIATEQTLTVTVKDAKTGAAIENARVLVEAASGGALTAGTAIIDAVLTNVSGVASATFDYTSDQPVTGRVRKGSVSTAYKTGSVSGTITAAGFDVTVLLVPDE